MDALADYRNDAVSGAFNPLRHVLGAVDTPAGARFVSGVLTGRLRALAEAFDALPLLRNEAAVREATVEALTTAGHEALGTLSALPRVQEALA